MSRFRRRRPTLAQLATAPLRVLPDALVIGAQRCGTSSLSLAMRQHPLVLRGRASELHFFDGRLRRLTWWYRAQLPLRSEVERVGREHGQKPVVFDCTPSYLYRPFATRRMATVLPKARLIALVRNPIDRALSHFQAVAHWHEEKGKSLAGHDFDGAVDEALGWLGDRRNRDGLEERGAPYPAQLLDRGRYARQLERLLRLYPREQLLVIRSEDLYRDPAPVHAEVLRFLQVPVVRLESRVPNPRSLGATMKEETRARLREFFATENLRLAELLGRDLDWS